MARILLLVALKGYYHDKLEVSPMRKTLAAFPLVFFLALTSPVKSQDIFDALRKNDIQEIKTIVEKTPQVLEARDADGRTPLHYAAIGGNAGLINFLIDKGAKLDLQDAQLKTPLHLAAIYDRKNAVAALLNKGAALEARDDYLRTALILCARERGQVPSGRILIEAGADVNAVDKFGSTALELAAWRGKREFVELLLEKGARIPENGPKWEGMLSQAASQGLANLFRRLIAESKDLKAVDISGEWLLQAAAAGGSAEIIGILIEKGFAPGRPDRYGWTPLHYAARDGRADAARILLEKGAPLDVRTIMGQTAFNVAEERGMTAAAELLGEKGADKSNIRFPLLKGDCLGQTPPGDSAELFGLGIISSIWGLHSTSVFSPDGNEIYWAPMMSFPGELYSRGGLLMMRRIDGRWTAPSWAPFSGPDFDDDVPFYSSDGKRIYFISRRPLPEETEKDRERIWFADRTADGWSAPQPLDPIVNQHDMHWQFSLDRQGNLYFAGQAPDSLGMGDIYLARFGNGKYEKPVNMGEPVNSPGAETTPFIAPDGSYLIFSRQYDLWVSFKNADGEWAEPIKLPPGVNSPSVELCPIVTADGKYLFFLSQRDGESHVYWVCAEVIEKLRPSASVQVAKTVDVGTSEIHGDTIPARTFRTLAGELRRTQDIETFLLELMKTSPITALSVAVVQDSRIVFDRILGVVDRKTRKPADSCTVFRTASLSKPVFSYLVMRLADEGLLGLEQPLANFIDPPFTAYPEYASLKNDSKHHTLTAGILLSHSGGFPNWRRPRWTGPLEIQFKPGQDFSYSGEGYYLLQFLLEKKTGRDLNALAKEKIFGPLGMGRSSFLWEAGFDGDFAVDLDSGLGPLIRRTRTNANSAASLLTNASDYAKFMLVALSGQGLKPETAAAWRTPRLRVTGKALHNREKPDTSLNDEINLSWTPGWGWFQSPAGEALFHVGMEEGCENYVVLFPEKKTGIVVLSVSDLSFRVSPSITKNVIGDTYSPFSWMRY